LALLDASFIVSGASPIAGALRVWTTFVVTLLAPATAMLLAEGILRLG
jgi:hypothetical protein